MKCIIIIIIINRSRQLKAADGKVVLVGMEMDILPTTCGYRWCAERTDYGQTRCKLWLKLIQLFQMPFWGLFVLLRNQNNYF